MICRFCKTELTEGVNWYASHARKGDKVCKDCRRVSSRESMRRFNERRTGKAVPAPKLTRDEHLARQRAYAAAFRARHRDRLNAEAREFHALHRDRLNAQARADRALFKLLKATLAETLKDQSPPTQPKD